jgi:hypothetical protein
VPSPDFASYASDERSLALLGREFASQDPSREVTLSEHAAGLAVAAWRRDHEATPSSESDVERAARDSAATLALIGLGIEERGVRLSDGRVRVRLHRDEIAAAVTTAQSVDN